MLKTYAVVVVICVLLRTGLVLSESHYINEWVGEIEGPEEEVRNLVKRYGFELLRPMHSFDNHYILRHVDVPHRSKRSARQHTRRLTEDTKVRWAEQQQARPRAKRDLLDEPEKIRNCMHFNDPRFGEQWYLTSLEHGYMSSVQEVWLMNITGKGIVVTIVDDGLEVNHKDLAANYDPRASYDLNDDDPDPMPRYDGRNTNKHGTRCGGEVAMVANNSICGVGIAYNAKLGGIRLLDGAVTDRLEANSLSFHHTYIDIYSLSWGPLDNGETLDAPNRLAQRALEKGISEGRNGKGVIYVLASGNGGRKHDNCNCDGYAGSIYTISVSSATEHYLGPWYGEKCSSTMATTYSSGWRNEKKVLTTDLHGGCTNKHTGTSASAPMASAIIALTLEANPNLTWRDVQHLIAVTSKPRPLKRYKKFQHEWYRNAAGFWVNLAFGFGIIDAKEMVTRAQSWERVPEQRKCVATIDSVQDRSAAARRLVTGGSAEVTITTDGCQGTNNAIFYLEHVEFVFSMDYPLRGAISAFAVSPAGTKTQLLTPRNLDRTSSNFRKWPLMSVHTWGENPAGVWRFGVEDHGELGQELSGTLQALTLHMYGSTTPPRYRKDNSHLKKLNNKGEETKPSEKPSKAEFEENEEEEEEEEEENRWLDEEGDELNENDDDTRMTDDGRSSLIDDADIFSFNSLFSDEGLW